MKRLCQRAQEVEDTKGVEPRGRAEGNQKEDGYMEK
jgi:hypothetical protein